MTSRLGPNRLSRFVLVHADNPRELAVIGLCLDPSSAQASPNAHLRTHVGALIGEAAVSPDDALAERPGRLLLGDKVLHGLKQHILL
jgi:hypothetical protein